MMTFKTILLSAALLVCSLSVRGEQYRYVKGQNTFEVVETSSTYEVICRRSNGGMTTRNKNILDRQFRMDAVDLIGAYILFKRDTSLPAGSFQSYVESVNLHYTAHIEGLKQEERTIKGQSCIVYSCLKEKYRIEYATYNRDIDISIIK